MAPGIRYLTALGLLVSVLPTWAASRLVEKTFNLEAGGELVVALRAGDVSVASSEDGITRVTARITGNQRFVDNYQLDFTLSDQRLEIAGKYPNSWKFTRARIDLKVEVPRATHLNLKSSGGDLEVRHINGQAMLRTSGGDIRIENLHGELDAKTSGGDVAARGLNNTARVHTSGGTVKIAGARGGVRATSSGGNLYLDRVSGPIYAKTSGGNIRIDMEGPHEGLEARTSGGNIHLYADSKIKGNFHARTSGGTVACDLPVTIRGRINKTRVSGRINGGGPDLVLSTSGGNIRVHDRSQTD